MRARRRRASAACGDSAVASNATEISSSDLRAETNVSNMCSYRNEGVRQLHPSRQSSSSAGRSGRKLVVMGVDPAVLAVLETAVVDTNNTALRLHLGQLLVEADEPARALEHLQTVLSLHPSDPTALTLAERAADPAGKPDLAAGYEQSNARWAHPPRNR